MGIKTRVIEPKLRRLLSLFPAVGVIGPRQCGKSTLVKNLYPQWKYYDLENPNDYHLISSDPVAFFSINNRNLIIDEAQQYPELFKILRGVIDEERQVKGRFLLTGSSSPEIVKGITESLAGRIATVELSPFKQGELYDRVDTTLYDLLTTNASLKEIQTMPSAVTHEQSLQVWLKGGCPEPMIERVHNPDFYNIWMENYLRDYVSRDISNLFPRLNLHNFRRFLMLLARYSGHQLNMSDMARALEVSVSTIKDYLDIIHQTFIWRNLEPYTKNPLKRVQKSRKGFFRDQGLLHYLLRLRDADDLLLHPAAEFSFESFAIEEIIRGLQATMADGLEYYYYRSVDKSEIDLVIEGFFGTLPIEIKLNSSVKRHSLRGLMNFINDMKAERGIIVNRGKRIELLSDKIIQIPVHYL